MYDQATITAIVQIINKHISTTIWASDAKRLIRARDEIAALPTEEQS